MGSFSEPPPPRSDYAQPELRALLDRGVEPLKHWILHDLAHAHPALGFHATTEWDNNVLACYLSHFLPKLPPHDYWQQDVLVVHFPEHWQNESYNRIYTQCSGNCLIPDTFHEFLIALTRAFGQHFIPVHDLRFWLERGVVPTAAPPEERWLDDERLSQSIAHVEAQERGTVKHQTVHVLTPFGTLEWVAMLSYPGREQEIPFWVHVKGEHVTRFDTFSGEDLWRWLTRMRHRGFLAPGRADFPIIRGHSLDEGQLLRVAEQIQAISENKAIRSFFRNMWGNLDRIARFQFGTTASFAEEAISSLTVLDDQGHLLLPDFALPFWQRVQQDQEQRLLFQEAQHEGTEALLVEVNTYLYRQGIFKDYALPDPKGSIPHFSSPLIFHPCPSHTLVCLKRRCFDLLAFFLPACQEH